MRKGPTNQTPPPSSLGFFNHPAFIASRAANALRPSQTGRPVDRQPTYNLVVGQDREIGAPCDAVDEFIVIDRTAPDVTHGAGNSRGVSVSQGDDVGAQCGFDQHGADYSGIYSANARKIPDPFSARRVRPGLKARLLELIAARRTTATGLARALGKDEGFIRDFLRGKKSGFMAVDLLSIERELRVPCGELTQIAAGVSFPPTVASKPYAGRSIPVYGRPSPQSGHGLIMDYSQSVDFTPAPSNLDLVTDAYACFVPDNSMAPRYAAGELVYVHPGRSVGPGAYALIVRDGIGLIRRICAITDDAVAVERFSPGKIETIARAEFDAIHRIVGSGEA